ncbi:MAG TPA: hypothetical protein VF911_02610, partial [Thermoanaerobaculia bacterium]
SAYVTKKLARYEVTDANDLTKPFRLTVEVAESDSGQVADGEASVAINLASLPQHIPDTLRDWKEVQPDENPDDAPKKRTHDFLFPNPGVREWVYRIVPPAGYVPRTLLPAETKKLGTTTFTQELHAETDNTVVATFRFDSGKRRLTPAEFQETRVAFTRFVTNNVVTIGFEQSGKVKLNAGDVGGALDEFRRLAKLHPAEAQHHIETAKALLAGGLGDAAREEIRRAVAIEPKNARAHQALSAILLNDSLGRPYRKGFDLKGAIAALRKAKELDPEDFTIRVALATALSYGEDGFRYGRNAALAQSVEEVLAIAKDLGEEGKGMLPELTLLYAHMGRFADLRALAPTLDDVQQRDLAQLIATAAADGTEAAVRELGAFDQQKKRNYASAVAQVMLNLRLYPRAAALFEVATQGTAAAAEQRQFIEILKKLQRVEDVPRDDTPRGVVTVMFDALMHNDAERMKPIIPAEYLTGEDTLVEDMKKMDMRPPNELSFAVFGDLMASMVEVQQDGDESNGSRLRMRMKGSSAGELRESLFVLRENGRWMLRGGTKGGGDMTGATVLAFAAEGKLEAAQKWLNWTREDVKGGTSDDPLEGSPLATLWTKGKSGATIEEIRVAAASLAVDKRHSPKSEPILLAGREQASSEAAKAAIDLALASIYEERKDWPRMLAVTTRVFAANPESATAFSRHIDALLGSGRTAEATTLAKTRHERLPNDVMAVRALATSAAEAHDFVAAQQYASQIVDQLRPEPADFTAAAWLALFTGKELDRAIEHAQQAVNAKAKDDEKRDDEQVRPLHALAALYAETGRSVEARTALLQDLNDEHRGELHARDWYVLGRIAENYGVTGFAIDAYGKAAKDRGATSASELAQRRLDGLKKK